MYRYIKTAVEIDENIADGIDKIEADFDYVTSGIEQLSRSGSNSEAKVIIEAVQNSLKEVITRIGEVVSGNAGE